MFLLARFKTAIYCRLSHDDINKQSESIENQKLLIEDFINKHSDEFEKVGTYIDDGISGMTYDRAAYNQMMEDVKNGVINAIIVKDLSRIGREQIETLNLIKKEFILNNIRFVAITDDYDSFDPSKRDGLSTSVKLLLNDYYCADISKKVRAAQKTKMIRGDFIGSHAPYGYIKSPENKNKLIIDEEAAKVVRKIFSLYIGGMGKISIARRLNLDKIPNPTTYKQSIQKQNYVNSNKLNKTSYWTYSTVNKILSNDVYIGNTVQHKSEIKAYNIRKKVTVPKDSRIIVENTHDPIIDKDTFAIVQNMLKSKRHTLDMNTSLSKYNGILFCRECGRAMHKFLSKPKKDGSRYNTFKCGTYSALGKDMCTIHSIKESELDEIVLNEIRRNIKSALDERSCEYIKVKSLGELQKKQNKNLDRLYKELESCKNKRKNMLRHLSENIIDISDFKIFDKENSNETESIKHKIKVLENKLNNEEMELKKYNQWIDNILKYKDIDSLDRDILVNMIEKIYVSEIDGEKEIEIVFRFKNPLGH